MKNYNKSLGFTLIELLVVVAIIGVLSSVIIISLSSARNKATDAKIKGQLTSIKVLAEKYYDENGEYGAVCTKDNVTDTGGGGILGSKYISSLVGIDKYCWDPGVGAFPSSYSVAARLKSKPNTSFCVDSTGAADEFADSAAYSPTTGAGSLVGDIYKCH